MLTESLYWTYSCFQSLPLLKNQRLARAINFTSLPHPIAHPSRRPPVGRRTPSAPRPPPPVAHPPPLVVLPSHTPPPLVAHISLKLKQLHKSLE
ncbi:hypothetical protein L6452_40554 [Arctium lappa]|uniref:Uncharacterized protein n=1 Tax=Arctium lappa TaxID=4217 RepID=A0ACB8XM79_ARCLA|nr:hypothetical protein L6452_40554 [Arctium lappa]